MFALLVTREIATPADHGKRLETTNIPQMSLKQKIDNDIDIKILRVPAPGPGMPFLDSDTCAEGRGRLFISVRVFFPV
jgi:hypothetical protein